MYVNVNSSLDKLTPETRQTIAELIRCMLTRFSSNVRQITVVITDENGPRGGVDKLCRVNLMMPGLGLVTATAKHEKVMVAVAEASRCARRIVIARLKRRETLRRRSSEIDLPGSSKLIEA